MHLSRNNHFRGKKIQQLIIQPWYYICSRCLIGLFEEKSTLAIINKIIIIKIENLPINIRNTEHTNYRCPECNLQIAISILNIIPFTKETNTSIDQTYFQTNFVCFDRKLLRLARIAHQQ